MHESEIVEHVVINDTALNSQGPIRVWGMRSKLPLQAILRPGFFNNRDLQLRKNDRIELVCDSGAELATHATLAVDGIKDGVAAVSLLHLYKRTAL